MPSTALPDHIPGDEADRFSDWLQALKPIVENKLLVVSADGEPQIAVFKRETSRPSG